MHYQDAFRSIMTHLDADEESFLLCYNTAARRELVCAVLDRELTPLEAARSVRIAFAEADFECTFELAS